MKRRWSIIELVVNTEIYCFLLKKNHLYDEVKESTLKLLMSSSLFQFVLEFDFIKCSCVC